MQELATREGFTYLDLSQSIPYKSELFSDPSHLNRQGAIAIGQMLAQSSKIPWQSLKF
jgi:lysophospholipase L1-like esterase